MSGKYETCTGGRQHEARLAPGISDRPRLSDRLQFNLCPTNSFDDSVLDAQYVRHIPAKINDGRVMPRPTGNHDSDAANFVARNTDIQEFPRTVPDRAWNIGQHLHGIGPFLAHAIQTCKLRNCPENDVCDTIVRCVYRHGEARPYWKLDRYFTVLLDQPTSSPTIHPFNGQRIHDTADHASYGCGHNISTDEGCGCDRATDHHSRQLTTATHPTLHLPRMALQIFGA